MTQPVPPRGWGFPFGLYELGVWAGIFFINMKLWFG